MKTHILPSVRGLGIAAALAVFAMAVPPYSIARDKDHKRPPDPAAVARAKATAQRRVAAARTVTPRRPAAPEIAARAHTPSASNAAHRQVSRSSGPSIARSKVSNLAVATNRQHIRSGSSSVVNRSGTNAAIAARRQHSLNNGPTIASRRQHASGGGAVITTTNPNTRATIAARRTQQQRTENAGALAASRQFNSRNVMATAHHRRFTDASVFARPSRVVVYRSYPRSYYGVTYANGYRGMGWYYGPPGFPYYYDNPGVLFYASRALIPSMYSNLGYSRAHSLDFAVQRALAERGYYDGPLDGEIGPMSRLAIANFQADNGLEPTGIINGTLLSYLNVD